MSVEFVNLPSEPAVATARLALPEMYVQGVSTRKVFDSEPSRLWAVVAIAAFVALSSPLLQKLTD